MKGLKSLLAIAVLSTFSQSVAAAIINGDFENAPLGEQIPDPYSTTSLKTVAEGWQVSGHGTAVYSSSYGEHHCVFGEDIPGNQYVNLNVKSFGPIEDNTTSSEIKLSTAPFYALQGESICLDYRIKSWQETFSAIPIVIGWPPLVVENGHASATLRLDFSGQYYTFDLLDSSRKWKSFGFQVPVTGDCKVSIDLYSQSFGKRRYGEILSGYADASIDVDNVRLLVPEPSTSILLLGLGTTGLVALVWRGRQDRVRRLSY